MAELSLRPAADDLRGVEENARFSPLAQKGEGDSWNLTMAVEGVNCANCIQKIESALAREPEIDTARVNFSTKRLSIVWHGDAAKADGYAQLVEGLGYKVQPFDAARSRSGAADQERSLFLCMAVAGFASGNIMLLSFALWNTSIADMGFATRELMHWISALIAIPTVIFSGRPFFRSAWAAVSHGRTNMDVPISVGLILTTGMSLFETIRGAEHAYFDAVVMLVFFLLIGRWLDVKARSKARSAASDLLALMTGTARVVLADGSAQQVLIRDLREGMLVQLAMGERVPADAEVVSGQSSMDTSLVTGESLPVTVKAGDRLFSGMLNIAAPLTIRIAKAANDSLLADIVRLMEKAEQGQARYVRIADRVARLYTPVVHLAALVTFMGWLWLSPATPWQDALMIAVTVLIITCPCAIGLAVPVVQVLATGYLLKRGVMVKSGDAFERLAKIDTVILDKTGTLTLGQPALVQAADISADDLRLAASLAQQSRHPLAQAIASAYSGPLFELQATEHPGAGLEASWQGQPVRLGSAAWCGVTTPADDAHMEIWLQQGSRQVRFTFTDPLRVDAVDAVKAMQAMGLKVMLLSGDRDAVVQQVAGQLGLDSAESQLKPDGKFARLEALRHEGRKVCMIGDGLNDAPSLAGADASMSPSSAVDMSQNAADIVYMGHKLMPVVATLRTARLAQKLVGQNFMLAVVYNVIAIPLAMLGHVTPFLAALAMSGSSIAVILNSFRLNAGRES